MNSGIQWLSELASERQFFHEKQTPSLETINKLLDLLKRPDKAPEYRIIIGGTAGKGTTARYIEQTLLNNGKTVALLSSPHLQVVHERIRVNGQLISELELSAGLSYVQKKCNAAQIEPTYYEVIVATGIYLAAQAAVDILICEVGLGGDMDAVNAVQGKRLAAVTFIGADHLEMFDHNIEKLAMAKAGIFTKESVFNLSYEQKYRSIFNKISFNKIDYIKGIKDKMNKKIARKICEQILGSTDFIMQSPSLPARWEKVSDKITLDGAHSAPRFEYILPKIKRSKFDVTILGMSKNHDPKNFEIILDQFERIIWTEFPGSIPAKDLQKLHGVGESTENVTEALAVAKNYKTLVTGSLYLCGYAREQFYSSADIATQQTEFPL